MECGPQLRFSDTLHAEKYRGPGEDFREAMNRVASVLAPGDNFRPFRDVLLGMRFMPAGRIQAAMGSTRQVTPFNCYVSGTIEDSFVHGHGCIMDRAMEAAKTMRMGGGIGYDFSTLRPRGDTIKKLQSSSSGPVSFIQIFNAVGVCTSSSGHRRGAQMGVMRVDHPDIEEFIHAKQNDHALTGFNVSIAVTDEFMRAVEEGRQFALRWDGREYRKVEARALWEMIMRSTWDWAEPGVLFIDRVNERNNLWYCERIAATNPCGEQPLPPYGACLLGSFNLPRYMLNAGDAWTFDWDTFRADIPIVVRAMDNVIEHAMFPLHEQEKEARAKRRMGLGITGLANALEAMGHPYGEAGFLGLQGEILRTLRDEAYRASAMLAQEKGAFPRFDREKYLSGAFAQELPPDVRDLIASHGIRNSHLTSIAPTGTISLCADNVSSGIEPVFAHESTRMVKLSTGDVEETFQDYGLRVFDHAGRVSAEVTAEQHLRVLEVASRYVDSAVSKTCNVPPDMPWEDFKSLYIKAWRAGAKGCTTFQTGGKRAGMMRAAPNPDESGVHLREKEAACRIDGETGRRECD